MGYLGNHKQELAPKQQAMSVSVRNVFTEISASKEPDTFYKTEVLAC